MSEKGINSGQHSYLWSLWIKLRGLIGAKDSRLYLKSFSEVYGCVDEAPQMFASIEGRKNRIRVELVYQEGNSFEEC